MGGEGLPGSAVTWGEFNNKWFWPFKPFAMLKYSVYVLNDMPIGCYANHEFNLTKAMTTTKFEVCIVWLNENCYLVREE